MKLQLCGAFRVSVLLVCAGTTAAFFAISKAEGAPASVVVSPVPTEPVAEAATATATATDKTLPTSHALLLKAIREKRVLRFTYKGHARVVEPHAYGRNAKGDAVLHAYQTTGASASRPPPGWRTFSVAGIEGIEMGEEVFAEAREGYSPNELHLAPLWAEVPALSADE